MSPLVADTYIVNTGHIILQRNASSLSTESSEFEFDSCSFPELINDEPPLSPKLLFSPNYSPNGESALMASSINQVSAENASAADNYVKQHQRPINHERRANAGEEIKQRMDLRSLLKRRDLEQLPPLTNYNIKSNHQIGNKDIRKRQVPAVKRSSDPASTSSSAYSASPSSSPDNYRASHDYTNPCDLEDNHPDVSPRRSKTCQKRSKKWAFKLDFLRKGPTPRADPALNQSSNDKQMQADCSLNHGIISSNPPDHCSYIAGFDDSLHERDNAAPAAPAPGEGRTISNYQLNQIRTDHYRAAAAAGEAGFNQQINPRINSNFRAAAAEAAREARFNNQIHHYRVAAAAVITRFESPRQSTYSAISSVSSSPRDADNDRIRAHDRKISKSAPISPAGSPPRSGEGPFTHGRAPMSPHALHYQQQRARTEELRRKTFLPYRQSLLTACFFPLSPHHPPQAVY